MLQPIEDLGPGALRFPGGTQADVYHWRGGVGTVASRGLGEHVFRKTSQKMLFGTGEFLALADRLGAEPIITVNVPSGTPAEAAQWVRAVNITGLANADASAPPGSVGSGRLPPGTPRRVKYWEIGNEPYLEESLRPELTLTPSAYSTKANAIINAMKAADPTIHVGLPLRLDVLGTQQLVHFPGYASAVLRDVTAPIDFVALHNAYLPIVYPGGAGGGRPSDSDLYRATMAAARVVEQDFAAVRSLWSSLRPTQPLALAVTEYSAMYTLGGALDHYASSMGAALYVADVLRVFAKTPELQLATQWSISGNGIFGALSTEGVPRSVYEVLRAYTRTLRGRMLPASVSTLSFSSPAIGVIPAYDATPLVTAVSTIESAGQFVDMTGSAVTSRALPAIGAGAGPGAGTGRVRVLLQNKDETRNSIVTINLHNSTGLSPRILSARAQSLAPRNGQSAFSIAEMPNAGDRWNALALRSVRDAIVQVTLPPQSLSFLEFDLATATVTRGRTLR